MSVGIKNAERVRLTGQNIKMRFLDAENSPYSYDVSVDQYLGEGSSCICYEVTVYKNKKDLGQKRVLKQFYPHPTGYEIDTELDGIRLDIQGYSDDPKQSRVPEINRLGALFEKAFQRQIALANDRELSGVVVRPDLCCFDGATKYVLYETDYGQCLEPGKIRTVEEFLGKMYELACALGKLHEKGILYIDLKPSNILVSGSGKIKLFDFDAAVDMNNIGDVHIENDDLRYAVSCLDLIAPELRPGRLGEFEQNKRLFLNGRVDIYAFGAIMFSFLSGRYPSEADCVSRAYEKELAAVFEGRFRGELTQEEQELLEYILWKCIQKGLAPGERYTSVKTLIADLGKLRDMVSAPVSKRRRVYRKVNGRQQAAYVMDRYPLADYRRRISDQEYAMDSLILGDDPVGEDFLANIFSCAQMLSTRTVIRIALPGAKTKMAEYVKKWPLIKTTTALYLDDTLIRCKMDREITETPFAELRFYEWPGRDGVLDFWRGLEYRERISWIAICGSRLEQNLDMAEEIAGEIVETAGKAKEAPGRTFITYLDDRGDGFDLRRSEKQYQNVVLFPFSCNDKHTLNEKDFEKDVRGKAKLLHKYYMKEWYEQADAAEVWKDFSSEAYNVNSSLCSVLSIPYKLKSVGIRTAGSEAAAEFRRQVLDPKSASARRRFHQLIWLEHRRWMCFMATEGYERPEKDVLKHYAFRGNNDQRNKRDKLHPCICGCDIDAGICLDRLSHYSWDKISAGDLKQPDGRPLDPLDRMSVEFHQLCGRIADQMARNGEVDAAFLELERAVRAEKYPISDQELVRSLQSVSRRMLAGESNINRLWKKSCASFREVMAGHAGQGGAHTGQVAEAFQKIRNRMRVVEERNSYHDYKSSDRTILEVLPLLLISDDPIRRIHKPVAGNTWQNIASALIMEPQQLYLYTDDPGSLDLSAIRRFLIRERGLDIREENIAVKSKAALRDLKITASSVKSVLDITGLPANEIYEITQMKNLAPLPVIVFENGKVRGISGESEADHYGILRRHLSVTETFMLHHANVHSDADENYMLGLASNYEKIWEAYLKMDSFRYRILVERLCDIEKANYWRLDPAGKRENVLTFEKKHVPGAMVQSAELDNLLPELLRNGWIEKNYQAPAAGEMGTFRLQSRYGAVIKYMERIFAALQKHPYMHRYEYLRLYSMPVTGGKDPSGSTCYIYDDTLVVDEVFKEQRVNGNDPAHQSLKNILSAALKVLGGSRQNGEADILEEYDETSGMLEPVAGDGTKFRIQFLYKNRATRRCFLQEGNILEAYVYYTICKYGQVDDVRMNVGFTWDADSPSDALERGALTNEIDLVLSRNMQTFFISCKQCLPKTAHLEEIKYFADYFGVEGKAILITSNWGTSATARDEGAELITLRSRKMKVFYIDREMIGDSTAEMSQGNLARYLQNIFDGKKEWKEI